MEVNPMLVEHLPVNQLIREEDHTHFLTSFFQIHPRNFEFDGYSHGPSALKEKYRITKPLFRYFNKRNFLFSRFEEGIAIDEESWYSVIP